MEPDFSGWATKFGVKCSDGRTIAGTAFSHMDGAQVPLVWKHDHDSPGNVLGHVKLEVKPEGVRCHGFFNETPSGKNARALVIHKDVSALSIWANALVERASMVMHGMIREVSLVLAGANPKAKIDYIRIAHSDDPDEYVLSEDEAIIHGGTLDQDEPEESTDEPTVEHEDKKTVKDVFDTLTEEQQQAVYYMIALAAESSVGQGEDKTDDDLEHDVDVEGANVTAKRNIFEKRSDEEKKTAERHILSHDAVNGIKEAALRTGSLKRALTEYCLQHGVENIDVLFPDAKNVTGTPEFDKRRTEWVRSVLSGVTARPFARVKMMSANLTLEDARAKGYVKGSFKKEEWFAVTARTTGPTTIYKKQKLDRDDILDITDFDIVVWLKGEIRLMLEEEIARAILIGDGRASDHEDKIKDPVGAQDGVGIRSISNDHELYTAKAYVNIGDANSDYYEVIESVLRQRTLWKGTGQPNFYTTESVITEMLLCKNGIGQRRFSNLQELAAELRVGAVIAVEVMEEAAYADILGVMVNLADYTTGTDRGGEINLFDDFDLDYNKFLYLMETRLSGGLTKLRAAVIFLKTAAANVLVFPITSPTFVESTGVITIPTQTGVTYHYVAADDTNGSALTAGAQTAITAGTTKRVRAMPATGYYFRNNINDEWTLKRPSA